MKRLIASATVVAALSAISFVGCGGDDAVDTKDTNRKVDESEKPESTTGGAQAPNVAPPGPND